MLFVCYASKYCRMRNWKQLVRRTHQAFIKPVLLVLGLVMSLLGYSQLSQTFSVTGSFNVPPNITGVQVQAWGGGGGGSNRAGAAGGGGGGAYTRGFLTNLTPGNNLAITVGAGGGAGANGGASSVGTIVANGGLSVSNSRNGGNGGVASAIGGAVLASYRGGDGGDARGNLTGGNNEAGGGGGGSALNNDVGGNGTNGGTSTTDNTNGGNGTGNGGGGAAADGTPDAFAGIIPGGGGGGRGEGGGTSKAGAAGRVVILYREFLLSSTNISTSVCVNNGGTVTFNSTTANLPAGSYTVTYTISGGNTYSGSATVNVTASGGNTTGSFTTPALANAGSTTVTINNFQLANSYGSNVVANNTVTFNVIELPTVNAGAGLPSICREATTVALGGSVGGSATGGTWTVDVPGGTFSDANDVTGATWTAPADFVGTATFTLTANGSACGSPTTTKTQVVTAPAVSFTTTPPAFTCLGTSSSVYTTQAGQSDYVWTIDGTEGVDYTLVGGTATDPTAAIDWLTTGAKTVTVNYTDANGCTAFNPASNITTVSVIPSDFNISGDDIICEGESTDITVDNSEVGVMYQIKDGATNVGTPLEGNGGILVLSTGALFSNATLTVEATNIVSGCSIAMNGSATITATVAPDVDAVTSVAYCNNELTTAINFTSSTPGVTYSWTNDLASIGLASSGSGGVPAFTANNTTDDQVVANIAVLAYDGNCYSGLPTTFTIAVNPTPEVTNSATAVTCSETSPNIALTSNTPSTFAWTVGNITGGITGASDGAGATINQPLSNPSNTVAGTVEYIVTPTSVTGDCVGAPFSIVVTVTPRVLPTFTAEPTSPVCANLPVTYTTQPGMAAYVWNYPVGEVTAVSGQGTNSLTLTWTAGGSNKTVSVTYNDGCASLEAISTPIAVNIPATPNVSMSAAPYCVGSEITYTTEPGMTNYNWTFAGGTGGPVFTVISGAGTNSVTGSWNAGTLRRANVTYTDANGCASASSTSASVTVNAPPATPGFTGFGNPTPADGANRCIGNTVTYRTDNATTWSWVVPGIAGVDYNITGNTTSRDLVVTWLTTGSKAVSVTVTNASGCSSPSTTRTIIVNTPPVVTTTPNTLSSCNGDPISIGLTSDIPSTFTWTVNRNVVTNPSTPAGNGNTINQSPALSNGNNPGSVTYNVTATANTCPSVVYPITVNVNVKPAITTATTANVCTNLNTNINLTASVPSTFAWTLGANNGGITGGSPGGGDNIIQTLANLGTTNGSLVYNVVATNTFGGCVGANRAITVTVQPAPSITTNPLNKEICSEAFTGIPLTANMGSTYAWTVGTITGGITGASNSNGNNINQQLTNPSNSGTGTVEYIITPRSTIAGNCYGEPVSYVVTVNPRPALTTPSTVTICSGTSPDVQLISSAGSSFAWTLGTNIGGITGAAAGSGNEIDQELTNPSSTTVGSIIYNVTPTSTVGTCAGTLMPITVVVNPKPVVTTPATAATCDNAPLSIALNTSTPSNLVWTVGTITGGITGANGGSGVAGSATITDALHNPSNAATGSVVYIVTPTSIDGTCTGDPYTITVTVNPTASITSGGTATACSSIPAIPLNYAATSSFAGATYNWSRAAVAGITEGTVINQTANPIMETLTNTTAAAIPVTYKITPLANGCQGTEFDLVVTVQPHTDAVITSIAAEAICRPVVVNYAITSSGGPVDNYRWSRLAVVGVTNAARINQSTAGNINETLTVTAGNSVDVTYAITAMRNGCPGDIHNYVVTIRPDVTIVGQNAAACSGQLFTFHPSDVVGTALPSDTKFTWGNPTRDAGVTGGGLQSAPQDFLSQTLTNSTTTGKNAYYSVGAKSATACLGGGFVMTVLVNPTPAVAATPSADQLVCSGQALTTVTLSSPSGIGGTVLNWSRDNTTNVTGMGTTGGSSIAGTLINQTNVNQEVIFTAKATANNCTGSSLVHVTVKPSANAAVDLAAQPAVCSGSDIATIHVTNPNGVTGTDYTWTRTNTTNLSGLLSGSGNTIAGALINNTNTVQSTTFTITPVSTGCNGSPVTAVVNVNPTPQITATRLSALPVCSGSPISTINLGNSNNVFGTTYTWTRDNTTNIVGANSGTGGSINETFVNTTSTPQLTTITITATANGCSTTTTMDVYVLPVPVITSNSLSQELCNGESLSGINVSDNMIGTTFAWTRTNGDLASGNISGLAASGTGVSITGAVLTNNTAVTQITNFNVVATADAAIGGCSSTLSIPVTVYAPLVAPIIGQSQILCGSVNPNAFTITQAPTGGNGYSYQWERSLDNEQSWTEVSGATNATYTAPRTAAKFRLRITSGDCGTVYSNTVDISLASVNIPNFSLPSDDEAVCSGTTVTSDVNVLLHGTGNRIRFTWSTNADFATPSTGGPVGSTTNLFLFASSYGSIPINYKNTTNTQVQTEVFVTPVVYNTSNVFLCNAAQKNFTVTINPVPVATAVSTNSETICSGESPTLKVKANITDDATEFRWVRLNLTTNESNTGTSGNIAAGSEYTLPGPLTNLSTTAETYRFTITPWSRGCAGLPIVMNVTVNGAVTAGSISGDQVICASENPSAFTSVAGTGTGVASYQWQSLEGDCSTVGTYGNIGGATSAVLDVPTGLTATTSYRRLVYFTSGGTQCAAPDPSNCVTIYVNSMTAGTVTGDQTICEGDPVTTFGSTAATSTGGGIITYQWQGRAGTDADCTTGFVDIPGAIDETYTPSGLADSTFRRVATSTLTVAGALPNPQTCVAISNCVRFYINKVTGGTIANLALGNQIFCGNSNPAMLTSAVDGTGAVITYQWMSTKGADCNDFTNLPASPNSTLSAYDPAAIDTTTTYKRITISTLNGVGCTAESNCETITILNIKPGIVLASQGVCGGGYAVPFYNSVSATAGGDFNYKWEMSTSIAGPFNEIAGATEEFYAYPDPVLQDVHFRRVAYGDVGGQSCEVRTPTISLFENFPKAGIVESTICSSVDPVEFVESTPAEGGGSGAGSLTYQWFVGTSASGPWTDISGAEDAVYDPPAGTLPGVHYYYRVITSELANSICSVDGNIVTVTVYPGTPGTWTGTAPTDNTDWFNCANWTAGAVPTSAMDVTIPFIATQPIIDPASPHNLLADKDAYAASLNLNGTVHFVNNANLNITQNLTFGAAGAVDMLAGGTVLFTGNTPQAINTTAASTSPTFNNVTINNTHASGITLTGNARVSNVLNLVDGVVYTSSTNVLTLSTNATATSASNASFISGPIAKETNNTDGFTFPIGRGTTYYPAYVLPTQVDGVTTYTGEYMASNPGADLNSPAVDATLMALLADKYWLISKTPTVNNAKARVGLFYVTAPDYSQWVSVANGTSMGSGPLLHTTSVAVAHHNGLGWEFTKSPSDFNDVGPFIEARHYSATDIIYSAEMESFSPFTIGYGKSNILPIKLLSFEGRLLNGDGVLTWKIDAANDLAGFELQYSTDGNNFKKLADISASNNTAYGYIDKQLPQGTRFYRLLVKEKDGKSLYSSVILLTLDGQRTTIVGLTSTIVNQPSITGKIISAKPQGVRALVTDVSGKRVIEQKGQLQAGTNRWLINTGWLAQGMYFVTIITDDGVKSTLQFVKE
jgi:hypothetical protein